MQESAFDKIIQQIASMNRVNSQTLREQMQMAMETALANPDPAVQAMWKSVPSQEEQPTLDEFMNYLIEKNLLLP